VLDKDGDIVRVAIQKFAPCYYFYTPNCKIIALSLVLKWTAQVISRLRFTFGTAISGSIGQREQGVFHGGSDQSFRQRHSPRA
jgi:hypothetical protein